MDIKKLIVLLTVPFILGCTDSYMAGIDAYGRRAHVKCYSGSKLIYDGKSTGKIANETHSDGYFFKDSKTGKAVSVSGNCVITYLD